MKYKFLLMVCFILLAGTSKATHMAGADLTYQDLGNGYYLVNYTFYRDCIGIPAQPDFTLEISSTCGNLPFTTTLLPVPGTGQLISFVCPGTLTTCDGGSATGIQKWEYTDTIFLGTQCANWTLGVGDCCRNAAITTIVDAVNENIYVEAHLNNLSVTNNNSPVFSNVPIAFECINQDNYFNHGGIDADGDSLVYSFVNPLNDQNDPLQYFPGYSINNFLTSSPAININPFTGDIFMHPTVATEITVIAVLIEEYRNGVLIGSVTRDIQVYVVNCNNQLPTATGINGTNDFSYTACVGGPICFDIFTDDPDVGDTVTALWNQGIPSASFIVDSTGAFPIIHFCWTPTLADVRPQPYFFTVTVHDDACPTNGLQSYAYFIYVQDVQATVTSTNVSCFGQHNGQINIVTQPGYQHMIMPGFITAAHATHLVADVYTVDVSNGACTGTYYINITEPPPLNLSLTGQNATCSGSPASATAVVTGGAGSYDYVWSTNPPSYTSTITNLTTGMYSITVTDSNNCSVTDSIYISQSSPFTASMTATPATCNAFDGTASVSVSGGSGNFSYDWVPNVSSSSTANNLGAAIYQVTVTDNSTGCVQNVSAIVNGTSVLTLSLVGVSNATCESGEDGSASVMVSGGVPPYDYLWSPGGQTTASVNNLSPGNYSVMVADYNGCPMYLTFSIGFDFPAPVVDLGPDSLMCIGDVLVLDAGPGNSYLWNDNSTGQTLTVTGSGNYTVLVTDANGCEAYDEILVTYITCVYEPRNRHVNNSFFTIYPNPATSTAEFVLVDFPKGDVSVKVINSIGDLVWSHKSTVDGKLTLHYDMNNLPAGVYFIQVINADGMQLKRLTKL